MKLKSKAEVEILILWKTHCGYRCSFLDRNSHRCLLFKKKLRNILDLEHLRCKKCVDLFGVGG